MITPVTTNPDGTKRKHSRNKTFILDPKACCIRTYTRSNLSNEVGVPKVENFQSLETAEMRFKFKK
jgi:hypothetical protein